MDETKKKLILELGHLYNEGVKIFDIERENQKSTLVRAPKVPKNTIVTGYHRINT
ncbi:hypothetical protein [uncultured Methanoregula sp.]|uniref:hypothetical protein n=1 Tax=uncultured Methanoregula sp. TaxID=1005933 RepID=UPI002AAB9358|nr:hypothetical protein [uncultured Methanoregula sp.]